MPTKIEWAEEVWNPVTGCTKISEGCQHCYARRMARRLAGRHGYPEAPHHFDVTLRPDRLGQPLKWKKPRRVFVCSMGDLFHKDVPNLFRLSVFDMIGICPEHTFLVLTKRPAAMLAWYRWATEKGHLAVQEPDGRLFDNVGLGVTVENQDADWRIAELLRTPAAWRFVSVEPMLGPVDVEPYLPYEVDSGALDPNTGAGIDVTYPGLGWVICGAETGPGARPMDPKWARSLLAQCRAAGTPFFMKAMSGDAPIPDDLMVREFPVLQEGE